MSRAKRREMVDRRRRQLSLVRQCALLGISRSSLYYRPKGTSGEDLSLMGRIDRQYLSTPFYGSRRMSVWLRRENLPVNRKLVRVDNSAFVWENIDESMYRVSEFGCQIGRHPN